MQRKEVRGKKDSERTRRSGRRLKEHRRAEKHAGRVRPEKRKPNANPECERKRRMKKTNGKRPMKKTVKTTDQKAQSKRTIKKETCAGGTDSKRLRPICRVGALCSKDVPCAHCLFHTLPFHWNQTEKITTERQKNPKKTRKMRKKAE